MSGYTPLANHLAADCLSSPPPMGASIAFNGGKWVPAVFTAFSSQCVSPQCVQKLTAVPQTVWRADITEVRILRKRVQISCSAGKPCPIKCTRAIHLRVIFGRAEEGMGPSVTGRPALNLAVLLPATCSFRPSVRLPAYLLECQHRSPPVRPRC
jgi:hypothetical protein